MNVHILLSWYSFPTIQRKFALLTMGIIYILEITCPLPNGPENGIIDCDRLTVGGVCIFSCNTNYRLTGPVIRRCKDDEDWTGNETTCIGTCICQLSLNCVKEVGSQLGHFLRDSSSFYHKKLIFFFSDFQNMDLKYSFDKIFQSCHYSSHILVFQYI